MADILNQNAVLSLIKDIEQGVHGPDRQRWAALTGVTPLDLFNFYAESDIPFLVSALQGLCLEGKLQTHYVDEIPHFKTIPDEIQS